MLCPPGPSLHGTFAERRAERKGKVDAARLVCRRDALHAGDRSGRRRPFSPILPVLIDNLRAGFPPRRSPRKSAPGRNHQRPQRHARAKIWISSGLRSWTPQLRSYAVLGGWICLDFLGFSRPKRDFSMGYSRPGAIFIFRAAPFSAGRPEKSAGRRKQPKKWALETERERIHYHFVNHNPRLHRPGLVPANAAPHGVHTSRKLRAILPQPPLGKVARSAGWGVARCRNFSPDCTAVAAILHRTLPCFPHPIRPSGPPSPLRGERGARRDRLV